MNSRLSSEHIKAEAKSLGFFACGVAKADAVDNAHAETFRRWLDTGGQASMGYMARNIDKRLDPRLLVPGVKSIVCVALNYAPAWRIPAGELQFAAYALGTDYHDVMKQRLHALASRLGVTGYRAFCDTAPVLERYWAERSGLGWTGRNHQLIIPEAGSMFFLGELFIDTELEYDTPVRQHCGTCHACIDTCPAGALRGKGLFRSELCLSYQTIENRDGIPRNIAECIGDNVYGCDKCQDVCPHNRFATPTNDTLLTPKPELMQMRRKDWMHLSVEQYREIFKGSAVKRAKYEGLTRNIALATGQQEPEAGQDNGKSNR